MLLNGLEVGIELRTDDGIEIEFERILLRMGYAWQISSAQLFWFVESELSQMIADKQAQT